ncbi:MAG: PIN domain-containing protein [Chitinophagaceae bacterium]
MRLFADANILVSVLNKEYPLFPFTSRILSLTDIKGFQVFTSPVCLAIAFYFAEKKNGTLHAKQKINLLSRHISIAENTSSAVKRSLSNPTIHDFEDGLEYYAAKENQCHCIITEDKNDFYFSDLEVLGSMEFCGKYMGKHL